MGKGATMDDNSEPVRNDQHLSTANGDMKGRAPILFSSYPDTVNFDDVHHSYTNIGILTGYRPDGKPWAYYLRSIFQMHNETFNIWTHLIGMLFMVCLTMYHGFTSAFDDPDVTSPIWLHGVCCILTLLFSTLTHVFRSKSDLANEVVYYFDYAGISYANFGTHVLLFHHCYDRRWINFLGPYALLLALTISSMVTVTMCFARAVVKPYYPRYIIWFNLVPNAISLAFGIFPLVARINFPDAPSANLLDQNLESYVCTLLHLSNILFILTGTFYASHLPERFLPGYFDIIGHSHMSQHILITSTLAVQQSAAYHDIHNDYITAEMRVTIRRYGSIWLYFVFLSIINLAIVTYFVNLVVQREKKAKSKIQ